MTTAPPIHEIARRAKAASWRLAVSSANARNAALERIAASLERTAAEVLRENAADVADARDAVVRGALSPTLVDRLVLDDAKLRGMVASVRAVAALDDPIGRTLERTILDTGLELEKIAVPLGVVAAIFEARPDAVTQIATLALKSGNAVVLKGGSEAARSTHALVRCMREAIAETGDLPSDAVAAVDGRDAVDALLALDEYVDLVVPRGSNALVRSIQARTRIPVLGHADGICHVYLHASADPWMAADIVVDSKTQYPAACNAVETLLVDATAAATLLPPVLERLAQVGVEVRGCERTVALVASLGLAHPIVLATAEDWDTEYGALILSCKLVDGIKAAVAHVNEHGSRHTDAIVAMDPDAAAFFLANVDAAGVFHNASTRFADGYRYGLGAEVGVSTSKLHARGPVGLAGLTSYKYVLHGAGHQVADYSGPNARPFLHQRL